MSDDKRPGQPYQLQPWDKIQEQINYLDRSLVTIQGHSQESALTRQYIIGQIEALKWAARVWDAG